MTNIFVRPCLLQFLAVLWSTDIHNHVKSSICVKGSLTYGTRTHGPVVDTWLMAIVCGLLNRTWACAGVGGGRRPGSCLGIDISMIDSRTTGRSAEKVPSGSPNFDKIPNQ